MACMYAVKFGGVDLIQTDSVLTVMSRLAGSSILSTFYILYYEIRTELKSLAPCKMPIQRVVSVVFRHGWLAHARREFRLY